ncbi:MAG: hypothetical protein HOV68_16870 [Streptomycetaceae bacterium]|nr:hypothetical protein [Streptomycetaceae bacterium]
MSRNTARPRVPGQPYLPPTAAWVVIIIIVTIGALTAVGIPYGTVTAAVLLAAVTAPQLVGHVVAVFTPRRY